MKTKLKKNKNKPDIILLITALLLILLGFIILSGVSMTLSQRIFGNPFHFLKHQIIFGYIPGGILGFLAYKMNLKSLKTICLPLLFVILVSMVLVLIPGVGRALGGARRWLPLGPISFQPSEFLKLIFIIYLAAWLSKSKENKKNFFQLFLPFLTILLLICGLLIAQPDLSTLVIIGIVALIMYFIAGAPIYQVSLLIFTSIVSLAILIKTAPYRLNRLLVLLRPDIDPLGMGYQIRQSLIAVGSGGLLGRGLGLSVQKFGFLPHPMTDTIFAIFSEETGFIGAATFILLFLVFAWQGFKVARRCSDPFPRLMAIGITSWLVIQAFVNIGAIIGILPLTGIPLPFTSYGSSHLIVELIGVGILLNISKQAKG